jgi:hypothetical protein
MSVAGAFHAAADFLRRHAKSRAVREAEKRRQERRQRAAVRKAKRAGAVAGASGLGMFGYAITVTPIGMALVAAGGAAVAGILLYQLLPQRQRDGFSSEELAALPSEAEEWLLDRRTQLPLATAPSLDSIFTSLGDLPPHLARLDPNSTLAWEARRLMSEHLAGLVDAWCKLPSATRERDHETRERFIRSLRTVADELARVTELASRDERMILETRGRFLESRYRDGRLSGI